MDPKPGTSSTPDQELTSEKPTPPSPEKPIVLAIVNQVMHYLKSHPDKISFEEKKECAATLIRYKKFLYVLNNVIDAIVMKSIKTPNFGPWAALFCLYISEEDKVGEIFYQLLAKKCEKEVKQLCKIPFQSLDEVQFRALLYFYAELLCSENNTLGGKWKMVIGEAVYDMLGVLLDSPIGKAENFQCVEDVLKRTVEAMTTMDESNVGLKCCEKVLDKLINVLNDKSINPRRGEEFLKQIKSEVNKTVKEQTEKKRKDDPKGALYAKGMFLAEYLRFFPWNLEFDEITLDVDAILDAIIVEQYEGNIKLQNEMEENKEKIV